MAEGGTPLSPVANAVINVDWGVLDNMPPMVGIGNNVSAPPDRRNSLFKNFDPLCSSSPAIPKTQTILEPQEIMRNDDEDVPTKDEDSEPHMETNNNLLLFDSIGEKQETSSTCPMSEAADYDENWKLQDQLKTQEEKIKELEALLGKSSKNDGLEHALADYEKRMTATALEVEDWKAKAMDLERDKMELVRERDQAQEDLHNVEAAFSDLHSKYERVKEALRNNQKNQELLEARDIEMQERLSQTEGRIEDMEQELKQKISSMYSAFETRLKNQDSESARLRALVRKLEMKNETLESEVRQKNSEVAQLNSLCDELINNKIS